MSVGDFIGHYQLVEKIGEGGMGVVYKALDERLDREVAVKVLPERFSADRERLARFEREARAAAAVDHPNILAVHELGHDDDLVFIVTELLAGEPLSEVVGDATIPLPRAVEYGEQVALGLAAAHDRGVVHRDLKPDNIFITSDGRVKILDFGLAKLAERGETGESENAAATASLATSPGQLLGTVGYMSPEQVRAEAADARSDIFALGCVLYEMVLGRPPFRRETAVETMTAILREQPDELPVSGIVVPSKLGSIIDRCLEKRPERRFQSAHDLAFALRQVRDAEPPAARTDAGSESTSSIAVLPFANLSAEEEQEYFCDGMAEEIINALTRIEDLRVVARTSSFAFKNTNEDIREIGTRLGVDKVLEGSVRKAGDRLRITAQLINVADGYHLWSERFDRRLEDVFAIQDEIASAIVDRLAVDLGGTGRTAIAARPAYDLDAYNLYLKGLHHWNGLTPESYQRSRECYLEAIRIDPECAPAYAGLAIWHISRVYWADERPLEVAETALQYAEKAQSIDDNLPEPYAVIANRQSLIHWEWESGERSLLRAAELGPNVSTIHQNLAAFYVIRRRFDEAILEARLAQRLDPLSVTTNAWCGAWLAYAGRYEEGVAEIQKVIEMDPGQWLPHHQLGDAQLAGGGDIENARIAAERAVELSGGVTVAVAQLAMLSYLTGRTDRGDEHLATLEERSRDTYIRPTFFTRIHLARGEIDTAVDHMNQAVKDHDPWIVFHRFCERVLPSDPRIDAVLESIGL